MPHLTHCKIICIQIDSKGRKSSEPDRHHKDESKAGDTRRCHGCNRVGHDRDTCRMTDHPDFVKTGLWAGSATERAIRLWERDESKIQLPWTRRLLWYGRLSIPPSDHQLHIHPPTEMPVGDVEAMELSTSTPKTKVRLVGRISSRICRAIVVVLILAVRIVNVWYPHARPPLSSQR